jgi:predicted Zn-dependent peptidase
MALVVSGDVSPERIEAMVEADQAPRGADPRPAHRRVPVDEPQGCARERTELTLPVARPRLLLGIKEHELGGTPEARGRRQLLTQVALDLVFGRASDGYRELYESGMVDESFSVSYSSEESFGFTTLGGDTDDPERLEQELRERLARARRGELDTRRLTRISARLQGALLKSSDSSENVSFAVLSAHFRELEPFAALRWIRELHPAALVERLARHLDESAMSVCVVRPDGR